MRAFRLLLVVFGLVVAYLGVRYVMTGRPAYLRWALRLLGAAIVSGVLFFSILLVARLA